MKVVAAAPAPLNPPTLEASTTPTETMEARVSISKGSPLALERQHRPVTEAAPSVNALRLSGLLDPALSRHFLNVQPDTRDGTIGIDMVYEPRGQATDGLVNFYVLDQDALRRFVYGADFDAVELAAGSPKPFSPNPNDLVGGFTASGSSEYTVVPFSVVAADRDLCHEHRRRPADRPLRPDQRSRCRPRRVCGPERCRQCRCRCHCRWIRCPACQCARHQRRSRRHDVDHRRTWPAARLGRRLDRFPGRPDAGQLRTR